MTKHESDCAARDPLTLFTNDVDNRVAGEVLVGFQPEAAGKASADMSSMFSSSPQIGIPSVDDVLADIGVQSISAVRPLMPPVASGAGIFAQDLTQPVVEYFNIRFDPKREIDTVVEALAGLGDVAHVEPNRWREAFSVSSAAPIRHHPDQWGLEAINCSAAWGQTTGEPEITVAVIDTGVDLDHVDLHPLLSNGRNCVEFGSGPVTPRPGWVFEGNYEFAGGPAEDEHGHGTHVAGIVCCNPTSGKSKISGVTWSCRIMPVRALARIKRTSDGQIGAIGSAANIAAGIWWAVDHGAKVINLSFGSPQLTEVERYALDYAITQDVVVVAAMGNTYNSDPQFPAAFPGVIAVGAITASAQRAGFSSTGPHLAVYAPGVEILSTFLGNTQAKLTGTSMAAPHVAGVAALIRSLRPDLSGADVARVIRDTARGAAVATGPGQPGAVGIVDAAAALRDL